MLDVAALRKDFPILDRTIHGQSLAYLDNAATTQKPNVVLEAMDDFYRQHYANPHRGVHTLGEEATGAFEDARETVAEFINAHPRKLIFTRGTTEAINVFVWGWGSHNLEDGDVVVLTEMEHHANLVPWYILRETTKIEFRFIRVTDDGQLDLDDAKEKLNGAKVLGVTHVSNMLGTINPITELTKLAHDAGAVVVVDGAQAVGSMPVDVGALECDAYAFSAHKMYGPMGIGALFAHDAILEAMEPVYGGGEMIRRVGFGEVEYAETPHKFEAGTMPAAEAVGWAAAVNYLYGLDRDQIHQHETELAQKLTKELAKDERITLYGPTDRAGLVSFSIDGIHAHDLATILDQHGVEIRSGHHCAQPLHEKLGVAATTRASFAAYNTAEEIDRLLAGIEQAKQTFRT